MFTNESLFNKHLQAVQLMEDILNSIDKITLMETLSSTQILEYNDKTAIKGITAKLNEIIKNHCLECLKNIANLVNTEVNNKLKLKNVPSVFQKIFSIVINNYKPSTINIINNSIMEIKTFSSKEMVNIKDKIPEFADEVYNLIFSFNKKREIFMQFANEIVKELKQKQFILYPEEVKFGGVTIDGIGKEKLVFSYQKYNYEINLDYSLIKEEDCSNDLKEALCFKVLDNLERLVIKGNSINIQTYIDDICERFHFKKTRFMNIPEVSEKPYDFKEGYINKNFVPNQKNTTKFTDEFVNSIKMINSINCLGFFIGEQSIDVGTKYFCKFLRKEQIENDVYHIYSIRNGGKALIQIFKNGMMLTGYQRQKKLKKFGYRQ